MFARGSLELLTEEGENETITLDPEERQAIPRLLIRANELDKEDTLKIFSFPRRPHWSLPGYVWKSLDLEPD